jgi:hypothetical protein
VEGTIRERLLVWGALLGAVTVYALAHLGVLRAPIPGTWLSPWPALAAPRGGALPWLVAGGAALTGAGLARLLGGAAPWGIRWGLGAYLGLVLPPQALALAEWGVDGRTFRMAFWAAGTWVLAAVAWGVVVLRRRTGTTTTTTADADTTKTNTSGPDASTATRDPLWAWVGIGAIIVAGVLFHSLGRTVRHGARSWDGESYHLPVPLQWLATGSLTEPLSRLVAVSPWEIDRFGNPGNGHLLVALPLALGWDLPAQIAQWAFLPVAGWAVVALARSGGASPAAAALAALAFLGAPIVAEQAAVPMLDLATGALSLAGLAVLALAAGAGRTAVPWAAIATAALAFGLALGTKTTAFSHLVLAAAAIAVSPWPWHGPRRERLAALSLALGLLVLPALFWWIRSAALFGNPIHPIGVRILGVTLVDGVSSEDMSGTWDLERMRMRTRWEWLLLPFRDPEYSDEGGFGAMLSALLVPALVAGGVDLWRAVRRGRLGPRGRLALLAFVGLGLFWFAAARTPRFNLPLLGVMAALGAVAMDSAASGRARHALGAVASLAAALTLSLSLRLHGWDVGPPLSRAELLASDWPAIPAGIDTLPPRVVYNDTQDDESARICNYKLFGADHRHLVFDHPRLPVPEPAAYVARLKALGADAVFLRLRRSAPRPDRFATEALVPELSYEGREYRSTLFRVR